jgi:hypothetical protein
MKKEEEITPHSKVLFQHSVGRTMKYNERSKLGWLVIQLRLELVACHIRDKQLLFSLEISITKSTGQ